MRINGPQARWLAGALATFSCACGWSAPLHIYTWREDTAKALPGTSGMIWSRMYYPSGKTPIGMPYHTAEPPDFAAKQLARALKRRAPGERAVILDGGGISSGFRDEPEIFPGGDRSPESYADGGYPQFTAEWMAKFWREAHAEGVAPSFVVLDYEAAEGIWGMKQDFVRTADVPAEIADAMAGTVVAMQRLQRRLGASPDGHAPTNYVYPGKNWVWNHTAVNDFNRWFAPRRAAALRAGIFAPAWQVFGDDLPGSNYEEQDRAWNGRDLNNWPQEPGPISGNWSSPSTYLGALGQRYRVFHTKLSPQARRALRWVDCRNDVRSALARTPNVAPWYSQPDYNRDPTEDAFEHRLQWAAGLLHDRAQGVAVMLFWSDRVWTAEEIAFARPVLAYLQAMKSERPDHIEPLAEEDPEAELIAWLQLARSVVARL